MVKGQSKLRRQLQAVPADIEAAVTPVLKAEATAMVAQMRALAAVDGMEIGWTDGDVPKGAFAIARSRPRDGITITFWAKHRSGNAAWFEFGTALRRQKSGKSTGRIVASPFFFPVYRAHRAGLKRRINKAVRDAVAKA